MGPGKSRWAALFVVGLSLVALSLVGACGTQSGTEKGDNSETSVDACVETGEELALEEVSPLGFSGEDLLGWLSLGASASLSWSDGSSSQITFGFAEGTRGVRFQDNSQAPYTDVACDEPDALYLGVAYTIRTDDGRLDEAGDGSLWSPDGQTALLVANTRGQGGPLDACGDGSEQGMEATLMPGGTSGRLDCEGEHVETMATW